MSRILIDTSVIIDFLRRKDKEVTLLYTLSQEELYISIITHTELYAGKSVWEQNKARQELKILFSGLSILPLIEEISQNAGRIKAYNHDLSLLDCVIAATALYHKLPIVTLNRKDFERIESLQLLNNEA